jgi:DNA-binding transcriptional MocR family regulator
VPLIEDATFADLHYGMAPVAAQGLGKDQDVILCASLTKTLAPGFRLGWVNGGRFKRETSALKKILSGDQPEILQCTLRMYLESGGYERHLRRARQNLASRMQGTIAALKATFPEGTRWTEPSGGFLLWVELPRAIDWDILQGGASRLGLRVAPGRLFSRTPGFERHFRLNFAQADAAKLVEHLGQFGAFLTEACRCGG